MELSTYITFVISSAILVIIPGPVVSIVVANSLKHGTKIGLITVSGALAALAILLTLVTLGLSAILSNMGDLLTYIKWFGVVYLIYIGYKSWVAPATNLSNVKAQAPNPKAIFLNGFIASISNPKSMVFFGAFFPQFLNPEQNLTTQLAILSITFFVIAGTFDATWTITVVYAKKILLRSEKIVNRVSGGFLMLGGGLLALVKES